MDVLPEQEENATKTTAITTATRTACQCGLCTGAFDTLQLASPDTEALMNIDSSSSLSTFSSSSSTVSFQSSASASLQELDMVKRVKKGMAKPLGIAGTSSLQTIGDYVFLVLLHQGSTAQIKMAEQQTTHDRVVVKITPRANKYALLNIPGDVQDRNEYKKRETSALERLRDEHAFREAQILMLLRHPYLPQVYDFITTSDHYYLAMEHINGTPLLFHVIRQHYLSEASARRYAHQVWRILDYLHGHAIVHLDVRIDNLILAQDDQVKLLDFSAASICVGQQPLDKRKYLCRSIHYTAPELLDTTSQTFEGPPVDVWDFGVLIYIMVTGGMPFEGYSPEQVSQRILDKDHVRYPDSLSRECRDLLQSMLTVDPSRRITLAQVAQHPWFRSLPPSSDIPIRRPLKPPLDPLVIQKMARAFSVLGSPQRIAARLTDIIERKDHSYNHHPFVLLYHLHQEHLAFPERFSFENDSASTVGEDFEHIFASSAENPSDYSLVTPSNTQGGLQLVFHSQQQEESPQVDQEEDIPQPSQYHHQIYHHRHHHQLRPHHHRHRRLRLLRRIKNWLIHM